MAISINRILQLMALLMLFSSLIEAIILRCVLRREYDWRGSLASLAIFMGRRVSDLVPLSIAMPGAQWLYRHRLFAPESLGAWSYVLLFCVLEFFYYWSHRINHRSRWFWTQHAVHH